MINIRMPETETVTSSVALFAQLAAKTAASRTPGVLVFALAPHALPGVVVQFAAAVKLPPGGPIQYLFAAAAGSGAHPPASRARRRNERGPR